MLIGAVMIGASIALFMISELALGSLIDSLSVQVLLVPLLAASALIVRSGAGRPADAAFALGVPLGLLGGAIGLTGMAEHGQTADKLHSAAWIMLLIVLYGGVCSALGHFASTGEVRTTNRLSMRAVVALFAALTPLLIWTADGAGGLSSYLSPEALSVFLAVFGCQRLLQREPTSQQRAEAALFGAIMCLLIGLIGWYEDGGLDRGAISIALNGLNYGLCFYLFIYLASLTKSPRDRVDVARANWHWMEVTAFMAFMLFAPETVIEALRNQHDEELESVRVERWEARLEALERAVEAEQGEEVRAAEEGSLR
ncbi:MAG: hypothetical protein VX766_00650 [Pseudomonadota bacterium]|nr:hypothetical protein [Pseudomonadota bacterium]